MAPKAASPNLPIEEQTADLACQTWGRNPDWIRIAEYRPTLAARVRAGRLPSLVIRPPQELLDVDRWRVVLYFCEVDEPPSRRVFDVRLQGETVLEGFSICEAAGSIRTAIAKQFPLDKAQTVTLELVRAVSSGPPPIISGLEIVADENPGGS